MRLATAILMLYIGFVAGSLQVLAFKDRWEVLGVVVGITILAIFIMGMRTSMRMKPVKKKPRTIPRRASVARNRSAAKGKVRITGR